MAWKDTAVAKATVLDQIIKEMTNDKDKIPAQLVESVNNISMISSDIELLKANHKANLKPLVHQASGLIIVFWRLYLKDRYPSLWPPPPLNRTVAEFVKTVESIRKLLARKCEKIYVKKKIFMVLDLGKVKKYLCKLDAAAINIEGDPRHVVDVNAVLLEAVNEHNNPQDHDEEAQILGVLVEDIIPEPGTVVEGSRQREAEIVEAIKEDHEAETSESTQNSRETLTSQSPPSSSQHINASFNNTGSGVMINRNIGNIYNATITNVGNNNSLNQYHR